MATQRRIVNAEKTHLDADEQPAKSDIKPAVPASVIVKLLGFTFAMITCPIGAYFLTRDFLFSESPIPASCLPLAVPVPSPRLFTPNGQLPYTPCPPVPTAEGLYVVQKLTPKGNSTYAGATAAVIANVVLIAYIVVAFNDDQTERLEEAEKEKKKTR
ncbi:VMA21-like domain-containing protein [Elsinoe fawcettii]|nr:VMA21-like domain-containing protein [Elsinoe fawcettii]